MVECIVVVFSCGHLMSQCMKLEILSLKILLWSQKIVSISLVSVREFNLIYFVFNHQFAGKNVVKGANIRMVRGKCACSLD